MVRPEWHPLRRLCLALALTAVSGCTVVPGSHMSGAYRTSESTDDTLPSIVRVHGITSNTDVPRIAPTSDVLPDTLTTDVTAYDYIVGIGDILTITVWEHPELTIPAGSFRSAQDSGTWVHNDGTLFYPYAGIVKVAGLRMTEIRKIIADRLSRFIENPQVDVQVAGFRSQKVYVTGSVNNPGTVAVTNVPLRVLDAVNSVGGLDEEFADWENVTLTRDGRDYQLSLRDVYERGNPRYNILLRDGDVVNVGRATDNKVFVLGEVNKPGAVVMPRNGLSLAEALANGEGFNEAQADAAGIFVMRRTAEGEERFIDVYQLNAREATTLILADEFALNARDIVYVTAAPIARWNRVINQILPSLNAINLGAQAKESIRNSNR